MKLHKTNIDKEIYFYFLKNGEKRFMYRHKYYDTLGKRKEKKKSGFKTEKEALRDLLEVKASILDGNIGTIEHDNITVAQLMDLWYETKYRSWSEGTEKIYSNAINNHIKRLLGNFKLKQLTSSTYEKEFINKLYDSGYKQYSIYTFHNVFNIAINFAVEQEILHRNRFTSVKIETYDKNENFLTTGELVNFLDYVKQYGNITEYTLTFLLAYSGMRKGEALGLTWSNVDFELNEVTIEASRYNKKLGPPKSKNGYRTIELDTLVMAQLKRYLIWCKKVKLSYGKQHKISDLVFIDVDTGNYYNNYLNNFFDDLYNNLDANGIKFKRITPHGLRHTHATALIEMNVPPNDVAYRLGDTIETIHRVYAHSFKKINDISVKAFSESLKQSNNGAEFGAE